MLFELVMKTKRPPVTRLLYVISQLIRVTKS